MAALVPVVGIPATLCALYYSWKITFNTTSMLLQSDESESNNLGAAVGTGSVFVLSSAFAVIRSRNSPQNNSNQLDRPAFTTTQFLKSSRNLIIAGSIVWCISAVGGGIGNVIFGKFSPRKEAKKQVNYNVTV